MKTFSQLKKNLKNNFSALRTVKVALLGDTATQFLAQALRGEGFDFDLNLEVFDADFAQIERQLFDMSSEIYAFRPDIVILFRSSHKLLGAYNKTHLQELVFFADAQLAHINKLYSAVHEKLQAKCIYYNYPEINDSVFGNFANKSETAFLFQLRKLNFKLMEFALKNTDFYVCDLSILQNQIGKSNLFPASIYVNTEMVLSLDALPLVALSTLKLIGALYGNFKKCLILDLDNTLWGGVIGDDGIENIQIGSLGIGKAFTEFQYWIKKLKNRGIILAVCSKNTESVAREPFEKHPDMVLHLEDISVFVANWDNKVDNIRHIQRILNIGFDAMVFLDDNPFERNMVRENIPAITVPELPEDPADYLEYLYSLDLFETVSYSREDFERTKLYQLEAKRSISEKSFTCEDDFLKSLDMLSLVEPINAFNTPRVAQLSQRSNQYNLRTIRYSEADIERIAQSEKHVSFTFTLEDKFGENGLICVIILTKENTATLFIDTWFMSCRVLKRGMEHFVLNTMVEYAKKNSFHYLKGEYIPTAKNEMVKDHYRNLGFEERQGFWILPTGAYENKTCCINKK